jgi:hypothetical protein
MSRTGVLIFVVLTAQLALASRHADVLVYGSEPEAVIAAVAAAEEGAATTLIAPASRLGGLFVQGELNVLDLKTQPHDYQLGLFDRWWSMVGRDEAFDVHVAEAAFNDLLVEAGVTVFLGVTDVVPLLEAPGVVRGASFTTAAGASTTVTATQVIDASGDADLAAEAGMGFDIGWRAFGVDQRMADTLVLNVAGVDWQELTDGVRDRGRSYAIAKEWVVWGHFGGMPAAYQPTQPGMRLRGLNLGRQRDGTVLINALLLYGLDPLDPDSLADGRARALVEGEHIVAYLATHVPGFADARLAGAAETLYVRESRHLRASCVLSADDVFENRVTAFDVAAGGYPMDAQSFTPHDSGFVYGVPEIYGGRLCMMVPSGGPAGMWVVGRSAGYDPVAFASARVVPFGMAMAEAAGVAAALAGDSDRLPQTAAQDPAFITTVRERLAARGAYLPGVTPRAAIGPTGARHYDAFRLLVSRGLSVGGYDNDPRLTTGVSSLSFAYLLSNVAARFYYRPEVGQSIVDAALEAAGGDGSAPLTADVAAATLYRAVCLLASCPAAAEWQALSAAGLTWSPTAPTLPLDRGEGYALAAALARGAGTD